MIKETDKDVILGEIEEIKETLNKIDGLQKRQERQIKRILSTLNATVKIIASIKTTGEL